MEREPDRWSHVELSSSVAHVGETCLESQVGEAGDFNVLKNLPKSWLRRF